MNEYEFDDKDPRYLRLIEGVTDPEVIANMRDICCAFQKLETKERDYEAFKNAINTLKKVP